MPSERTRSPHSDPALHMHHTLASDWGLWSAPVFAVTREGRDVTAYRPPPRLCCVCVECPDHFRREPNCREERNTSTICCWSFSRKLHRTGTRQAPVSASAPRVSIVRPQDATHHVVESSHGGHGHCLPLHRRTVTGWQRHDISISGEPALTVIAQHVAHVVTAKDADTTYRRPVNKVILAASTATSNHRVTGPRTREPPATGHQRRAARIRYVCIDVPLFAN